MTKAWHGKWQKWKSEIFLSLIVLKKRKIDNLLKKITEKDLENVQELLNTTPNQQNQELLNLNKQDFEQIEKEEMNALSFRSKIKWTEEAEQNIRHILTLETLYQHSFNKQQQWKDVNYPSNTTNCCQQHCA